MEVLTLETVIAESVIPGIAKLLQNSPSLKKVKLKLDMVDIIPVYTYHSPKTPISFLNILYI